MYFSQIPNAADSLQSDRPLMQKEVYPVSKHLQQYLQLHQLDRPLPVSYKELLHYEYTNAIKDASGKHTHWEKAVYKKELLAQLEPGLIRLYTLLTGEEQPSLSIASIDFCEFANSMPFRINLQGAANADPCFYIKNADASRIYGLELERLLTSNPIRFIYHDHTLVETHISGIPGDEWLATLELLSPQQQKQAARAFVQFNESCFARLLGDMRSYNFVANTNAEGVRFRAIDFDQQSYEGRLNLYLPQFYKENRALVTLVNKQLKDAETEAIRLQERQLMASRAAMQLAPLQQLFESMRKEELSDPYKILSLRKELNEYHQLHLFNLCQTMGQLVQQQLHVLLQPWLPGNISI